MVGIPEGEERAHGLFEAALKVVDTASGEPTPAVEMEINREPERDTRSRGATTVDILEPTQRARAAYQTTSTTLSIGYPMLCLGTNSLDGVLTLFPRLTNLFISEDYISGHLFRELRHVGRGKGGSEAVSQPQLL